MAEQKQTDRLLVRTDGTDAIVRVEGRGSFKVSAGLKEFGLAAHARGAQRLLFDMAACVGMDSTFMGVSAGLAVRYRQSGGVWLLNLTPKTHQLITTLGLDRLVHASLQGEAPRELTEKLQGQDEETPLAPGDRVPQSTAAMMLEAHEALVDIAPENLSRFRDVLTYLREDVKKNEPSP